MCTRTVASSPCCPVVGLAVVPHPLLMVVLLATYEVTLPCKARPAFTVAGEITGSRAVGNLRRYQGTRRRRQRWISRYVMASLIVYIDMNVFNGAQALLHCS